MAREEDGSTYYSQVFARTSTCGATGSGLLLDRLTHTDETASRHDGMATIQASGGVPPLTATVVETGASQPATSGGQPAEFSGLAPADYTVQVSDSARLPSVVGGTVTVLPYVAPVLSCQDAYADTYHPLATADTTPSSCAYSPRWCSAWDPTGMAVSVPALAGQATGYTAARLRLGFRPGPTVAAGRPLGAPLTLRATVGPDGYATFRLGPYLRAARGAPDGTGGTASTATAPRPKAPTCSWATSCAGSRASYGSTTAPSTAPCRMPTSPRGSRPLPRYPSGPALPIMCPRASAMTGAAMLFLTQCPLQPTTSTPWRCRSEPPAAGLLAGPARRLRLLGGCR